MARWAATASVGRAHRLPPYLLFIEVDDEMERFCIMADVGEEMGRLRIVCIGDDSIGDVGGETANDVH